MSRASHAECPARSSPLHRRARTHFGRSRFLGLVTLAAECVGVTSAVLIATGTIHFDLITIAAQASAAFIAWERARQDSGLAHAYSIAAQELASIRSLVQQQATEADWSSFVDEAEEAMSREHTLWRASRSR